MRFYSILTEFIKNSVLFSASPTRYSEYEKTRQLNLVTKGTDALSGGKRLERLKKILRTALAERAVSINLVSDNAPDLSFGTENRSLSGESEITDDYLMQLRAALFPGITASADTPNLLTSTLQIANVGRLQLIAQVNAPLAIYIYLPPDGQAAFESDWQRLSNPVSAESRLSLVTGDASDLDQLLGNSDTDMNQLGGYIPNNLRVDQPISHQRLVTPTKAVPVATVAATKQIFPHGNTLLQMPVEAIKEHTLINKNSFSHSEIIQSTATHQVISGHAPAKLNFGPSAVGEADISDGRNSIDQILTDLVRRKGSDLHMTCGEPICFRIDGEIMRVSESATSPAEIEAYLSPIIPSRNLSELSSINDTDFAYEIRNLGRFRVNVFRDKNGIGSVMRHIPSTILTADQLNLPPAITKFCSLSKGLVLVTGPTGSGKSTTLAAMIDLINKKRADHILTIEDPIEFVHPQQRALINQREVHKHTGSFARALKAALREDPDIVLIGEMRDLETVAIGIETAETGHLVFGTLHTNTAVSTVDRIIDQFPTDRQQQIRMMLASSLKGVVAQTLLRKKNGGRVAAHEILVTNDAVSAMIREGKNHMIANHMQTQKQDGNILLNESLLKLVRDGIVDQEDALRKAVDKNGLLDMMKRAGIAGPTPATPATPPRPPAGSSGRG